MAEEIQNTNDLSNAIQVLGEIIEHYQITSFVSDSQIAAMQKIQCSLQAGQIDQMWDCVCDFAIEFIEDIEDQPEWFESIYDMVRALNSPEILMPAF